MEGLVTTVGVRRPPVVFIRGITPRSGTNYLRDLLALHPGCHKAREPVWEDFALDDSALLERYVRRLSTRWPQSWGVPVPELSAELLRAFGDALVTGLIAGPAGAPSDKLDPRSVVVAKTPSVRGLALFPLLFPDDPLILLVRDGRDVVESLQRSFGWSFERATRAWTIGAQQIIAFQEAQRGSLDQRWLLLRYEDVLLTPLKSAAPVLSLAGLNPDDLDPQKVDALPVRGSSTFGTGEQGVHWRPTAKDATFTPVRRWAGWTADQHARFNWVAGDAMQTLGYSLEESARGSSLRHRILDGRAAAEETLRRGRRRMRARSAQVPSGTWNVRESSTGLADQ